MTRTLWGLEFQRLDGRYHKPVVEIIPADTPPAQELDTLLNVMRTEIGARIAEMSPGRYALQIASQVWAVRIISIVAGKTQELPAVVLYDDDGHEVDSSERSA